MANIFDNVAAAIIGYLQSLKYTDNSTFYQQVYDGEPKNFENMSPVATVSMVPPFHSERYTAGGGRVKETSHWQIVTYIDDTNQPKAEQLLRFVVSSLPPIFQAHVNLGGVASVVTTKVGQAFPAYLPVQKLLYRAFVMQLEVVTEYFISVEA